MQRTIPRFIPRTFGMARYPNKEQYPDFSFTMVSGVASHPDWNGEGEPDWIEVSYEINTNGGRGKPGVGSLRAGSLYEIVIEIPDNANWNTNITEVILLQEAEAGTVITNSPAVAATTENPTPNATTGEQRAPETAPKVPTATVHHVDDQRAYSEWQSTILRTGQMAATERVRTYVDLIIAGKLYSKSGTVVGEVTSEQLDQLYARLFNNYMDMVLECPTMPSFADFRKQGGSNA